VRDLYQEYGIADTVDLDDCRQHYYRTQTSVNPRGIVALQPEVVDFTLAHGRERLSTVRARPTG
jgi:putative glutathione S-transferase